VFEGTNDAMPDDAADWRPYEFKCKPGDPMRRPCVISPYHYRLDWLMWFAAMSEPQAYPWTLHLVWKLLHNDPATLSLLANDPFPPPPPPSLPSLLSRPPLPPPRVRAGAWRTTEPLGTSLPPLPATDRRLTSFPESHGWRTSED